MCVIFFPLYILPKSILWFIYIQRAYCDTSSFLYLIWKWCVPEFLLYLFLSTFPCDDDGGTMFFSLNLPPNLVPFFYVSFKGQLISKCLSCIFNSPKKQMKKFNFTTMVPQIELFSFVFWENWRHQKDISKLTDLLWHLW